MQAAGEITGLMRQVPFVLAPAVKLNGRMKPALRFVADHCYYEKDGTLVVEDVKSKVTRKLSTYILKRKLMLEKIQY